MLASLEGTLWSLDGVGWTGGDRADVVLRKWPGVAPSVRATVDLPMATIAVEGGPPEALGQIEAVLEASPGGGGLAAALEDALLELAASDRPGAFGQDAGEVKAEVRDALDRVRAGTTPRTQIRALFAPTGDVGEIALANGWTDRYLRLGARVDRALRSPPPRSHTEPPHARPAAPLRQRVRCLGPLLVLAEVAVVVAVTVWLGGGKALLGLAAVVAGLLLPVGVALVRFVRRPVTELTRGPRSPWRRRWARASRRQRTSMAAWVALRGGLVAWGVIQIATGVWDRWF